MAKDIQTRIDITLQRIDRNDDLIWEGCEETGSEPKDLIIYRNNLHERLNILFEIASLQRQIDALEMNIQSEI